MDVLGEHEALQQFFEGKSLVVREGLSNFWWQQKIQLLFGVNWRKEEEKEPWNPKLYLHKSMA